MGMSALPDMHCIIYALTLEGSLGKYVYIRQSTHAHGVAIA